MDNWINFRGTYHGETLVAVDPLEIKATLTTLLHIIKVITFRIIGASIAAGLLFMLRMLLDVI